MEVKYFLSTRPVQIRTRGLAQAPTVWSLRAITIILFQKEKLRYLEGLQADKLLLIAISHISHDPEHAEHTKYKEVPYL